MLMQITVVLAVYIDSYLFVFVTAVLQFALGVNKNVQICDGAILLCLVCYLSTKVLIYLFLVEKAVRISNPRGRPKVIANAPTAHYQRSNETETAVKALPIQFVWHAWRIRSHCYSQLYLVSQRQSIITTIHN